MKTLIFKNYSEFSQREDKRLNGVSEQFAIDNPNYLEENKYNNGCWNCSYCSDCSECYKCSNCSYCSNCSECSNLKGKNYLKS